MVFERQLKLLVENSFNLDESYSHQSARKKLTIHLEDFSFPTQSSARISLNYEVPSIYMLILVIRAKTLKRK